MPEQETLERAREDERGGLSPSTQAGEFVREEIEHIRKGEHGARSPEQAIAIGLSQARRAGVRLVRHRTDSRWRTWGIASGIQVVFRGLDFHARKNFSTATSAERKCTRSAFL